MSVGTDGDPGAGAADIAGGDIAGRSAALLAAALAAVPRGDSEWADVVRIPAGEAQLGAARQHFPQDAEGPPHDYTQARDLYMDKYEFSNERWGRWVAGSAHVTDAERYGWSFVHELALSPATAAGVMQSVQGAEWWLPVRGAAWYAPEGLDSNVTARWDHPVVHVSHADAAAACAAAGGRLPTEDEWEYAARGGKRDRLYPWGNVLMTGSPKRHRANVWQGVPPYNNTAEDGCAWTCPAGALGPQNGWGLHHMAGNVWEWTATRWCPGAGPRTATDPARMPPSCPRPTPPPRTRTTPPSTPTPTPTPTPAGDVEWVKKGGSFLCHVTSCYRYRCAARDKNTADTSAYNVGFRCVYDDLPPGRRVAAAPAGNGN